MPRIPTVLKDRRAMRNTGIAVSLTLAGMLITMIAMCYSVPVWAAQRLTKQCMPQYDFGALPLTYSLPPCNPTIGLLPVAIWVSLGLIGGCIGYAFSLHIMQSGKRVAELSGGEGKPIYRRKLRYTRYLRWTEYLILMLALLTAWLLMTVVVYAD